MIKKATNILCFDYYIIKNDKYLRKWPLIEFKRYLHLANIYYSFINKNKKINSNIYNMNCVEIYKYSCFLQKGNINNANIYKKINKRVEMIYKFLTPSKIILLIRLYLENSNLNIYRNTFNCLIEGTLTKLNEFNLDEIVKLYSVISKIENNQTIVYLFKYFNNHLINNYTYIDVKSFTIILNSHAKLKIRDIKLINKFLNIIFQNNLSFDIINYSILFNSFYKLRIIDNDFINKLVMQFLNEIDIWIKNRQQANLKDDNCSNKEKLIINKFINYYPHHICNILLFFTIYNINKIANFNYSKEDENEINFNNNIYINFLFELLIEKKNLLKCEEILILCQVLKSFKIKNNILTNHIEKELINYFNYIKEEKKHFNKIQKLKNINDIILFNDDAVIKVLFDLCTFYNDINIYYESVQYFLQRKKKVDFNSSLLLLYIYSEINHIDCQMFNLLIHVLNKNYLKNFQVENICLLIRSFYKLSLNNQHYFKYNQIKEKNIRNQNENTLANDISNPNVDNFYKVSSLNSSNNYDNKNVICENLHEKNTLDDKEIVCSNEYYFTKTSKNLDDIFYKIHMLSDNVYSKLEKELLEKKIELNESNISQLCKILYYSVFLRKLTFLNNVINIFINKEDINGFKNILNILYSYCYVKKNLYINLNEIRLLKENKNFSKKCDHVLKNYNYLINKRGYNNELKNMIYFIFIQCKLNDYSYINVDFINVLLNSFFLNIHLLSILLNSLICKDLNILINFPKDNQREEMSKIYNMDFCNDLKNNTLILIKNVDIFYDMKLYNQILLQINKLILKCQNIYDITRIFNSSFIFLNYIEKCKNENKLDYDILQGEKYIHSILKKIEKNFIENYSLYNNEYIILLSAISIYNNNYFYIPFSFFFEYFNFYAFKNFISYLILLSNDEEIKYISNCIFSMINYSKCKKYNKKQDIEDFYSFHISQIINNIKNSNDNSLSSFKINNIVNIYKLMLINNDILNNSFFKKIKDLYLFSFEINSILLNNLSLNELNNFCLLLVKKKEPNTFLFKYVLKKNYEYLNSKNEVLNYDYIINLLNISINLKKYNFSVNDQIIINTILKNVENFKTLHQINTLLQNIYLIKTVNDYNNLIKELFFYVKKIYMNYFVNNETINLNEVVYLLYLSYSFNNSEIFYNMFQLFGEKFFKLKKIIVHQKKKYNFVNSLTNTFFIAKKIYSLNENANLNLYNVSYKFLEDSNLNDEYIIYIDDEPHKNNIETNINEENNIMKKNALLSDSTSKLNNINCNKIIEPPINCDENKHMHYNINEIYEIKDTKNVLYINDYTFIILFLLLDLIKNEKKIESVKFYSFIFTVFKDYIYFLNKEVIIECLYIYFFSQINNELSYECKEVKMKNFNNDPIYNVLNILITFIHNLEISSVLKLSFIYINLFFFSHKNCQVKENTKILFEHIKKKKNSIEKNNILYDQLKKYENI
ncbi:conserved Plasmodium protein, unknown function [Plasmodium gallinaceum]|uniref:Uncharacterized protein n=1 Tax=Plasmodium gallinaceum TaxID=5849 RepID=A0A1J1GW63_PLAGA|nr:conserved Plasmodium protein, unknown function [Plasmodium gallinaceum]CRG96565.1 conserved Plasmodium protein, unknown function [Plasmodium gallinaceum]